MSDHISVRKAASELGLPVRLIDSAVKARQPLKGQHVVDLTRDAIDALKKAIERPAPSSGMRKPVALSFFSGAMGLDLGLEKAGYHIRLASEIDKAARATILLNRPDVGLIGDILDYSAADIRDRAGLTQNDDIDLIVGGPPCQAFSTAGRRLGFEDERGNVFLNFLELIIGLRPRFAVIENVRGLLSAPLKHRPHNQRGKGYPTLIEDEQRGGALRHILSRLSGAGYGVSFNLYNAANFGAPQKRERVIIVCSRDGERPPFLTPTHAENGEHGLPRWKTVREALLGLDGISHTYIPFPEKRLKYYRLLSAGQYWKHLPDELQKEALGASYYSGGGKTGFMRRVPWDEPAPTIVTHPAMSATALAHPVADRPLSVEEYKRLQGVPDDWIVYGSIIEKYKQLGNAVPTPLGEAIGELVRSYQSGIVPENYANFRYSRYRNTDDRTWSSANQFKLV